MNQSREREVGWQGSSVHRVIAVLVTVSVGACTERGITNPNPIPTPANNHPGFDTSIYPGDASMSAWLKPASPYEWVGYYLQAPCHRDPSWMGKRSALTAMGWGLGVGPGPTAARMR